MLPDMWQSLKRGFLRLIGSSKFQAAAVTIIGAGIAKAGFHADPTIIAEGVGIAAVAIGGQGLADHGKEAAKVAADTERWRASDEALAAKLRAVRVAQPPQP